MKSTNSKRRLHQDFLPGLIPLVSFSTSLRNRSEHVSRVGLCQFHRTVVDSMSSKSTEDVLEREAVSRQQDQNHQTTHSAGLSLSLSLWNAFYPENLAATLNLSLSGMPFILRTWQPLSLEGSTLSISERYAPTVLVRVFTIELGGGDGRRRVRKTRARLLQSQQ